MVPDSTTIQGMARGAFPVHRIDLQNGYPISRAAPNCVATKRLQLATNQLWTLGVKTVSVWESCERFMRAV